MKRQWIVYPLVFALFSVLALYSANVREVSPSQVIVPSVVVIGGALLLMGVSWLVLRNIAKAALLVAVLVVLCFSYGHAVNLVAKNPDAGQNFFSSTHTPLAYLLLVVCTGFGAVAAYPIRRTRMDLRRLTTILNTIGIALVVADDRHYCAGGARRLAESCPD